MSNTITVELSGTDRGILYDLINAVENLTKTLNAQPNPCTALPSDLPEFLTKQLNVPQEPQPEEPAEPEKPKATIEDIQTLVRKLAATSDSKRDAVKHVVGSYAKRVSEIPADKYDEVWQLLTELEGV